MTAEVERLLQAADDAETAANQPSVSAEEQRRVIQEAETLAGGEAGVPAKSSRVVRSLQSKWLEFLELHGDEYGFDAALGPTVEVAKHFSTWGFFNRERYIQHARASDGMGDSWGELIAGAIHAGQVCVCGVAVSRMGWIGGGRAVGEDATVLV